MKQHRMERILEALKQDFIHQLDLLKQASVDEDGRPMFWKPLTTEEQLARFLNEDSRASIEMNIQKDDDSMAVLEYREKMKKLMDKTMDRMVKS